MSAESKVEKQSMASGEFVVLFTLNNSLMDNQ